MNPPKRINIKDYHQRAYDEFIKTAEIKLENQAYPLKEERAIKCAIQAVRYVLRDIYNYYGFLTLRYIINYGLTERSKENVQFRIQNEREVMDWVSDDPEDSTEE